MANKQITYMVKTWDVKGRRYSGYILFYHAHCWQTVRESVSLTLLYLHFSVMRIHPLKLINQGNTSWYTSIPAINSEAAKNNRMLNSSKKSVCFVMVASSLGVNPFRKQ